MKNILLLPFLLMVIAASAQVDSTYKHRNNIKFNLSGSLLYQKMYVLSYERTISAHHTFSISGGYLEFPTLLSGFSGVRVEKNSSQNGFTFGGDYRFYLRTENKFAPPHGLYIGPYFSFYNFKNGRDITKTDDNGNVYAGSLDTKLNVTNLGAQLGYQFVLNDRITIDLTLFAPSISRYEIDMTLNGNFPDPEDIQNEILSKLLDRFPMLNKLLEDKKLDAGGYRNVLAPGLKYCVLVGYRFGK